MIFNPDGQGRWRMLQLIYYDRMPLLSVGHMWMIFTPYIPGVESALQRAI